MRFGRGLLGTALAVLALVIGAAPALPAVGGSSIGIQSAPWTVLISQDSAWGVSHCGGSIVDSLHVVTAAHCLYDPTGTEMPTNALSVRAGISNSSSTAAGDAEQDRAVSAARVFPGYVWTGGPSQNDVAVLTLSSPLALGSSTQAVALPAAGVFPAGAQAQVAGFGRESAADPPDGSLRQISLTVETQSACGAAASSLMQSVATALCASASASSICAGDSGSGLVSAGAGPVLLGIVSAGPTSCAPGSDGIFTWAGAPQILGFIGPVAAPTPLVPPATAEIAHKRTPRRARVVLGPLPKT